MSAAPTPAPASNDHLPPVPRIALRAPTRADGMLGLEPLPAAPPAFLLRAAVRLRRMLQGLADRVVPAHVAVFERSVGVVQTHLLGVAARLGIADLLADGPKTAEELASRTGTDPDALHRTLRALAVMGIFALDSRGRFANSRLSLATMGGRLDRTREWLQYVSSQTNVGAWADLARTVETGANAFERLYGMSVWDWFERHPDEQEMFANAMMGLTVADAPVVAALYPFTEVRRLCDVGGGRGTLLSEILVRYSHLQGVLCDAEGVLASARSLLAERGVAARVTFEAGSFFERVPRGADAYLLKNVLHDWDDERCRLILRTVRQAMDVGHRILLVEQSVPRNDRNAFGALADVQMMVVSSNGRERSVEELQALLTECGFEPAREFSYPTLGMVEGLAV